MGNVLRFSIKIREFFVFSSIVRRIAPGLLPIILVACGSAPTQQSEAPKKPIDRLYTIAYINSITTTISDDDAPDEKRLTDKKELEGKLPALLKSAFEEEGFAMPAGAAEKKAGAVVVTLDMKYNPGNRSLRWLTGPFGAGKGTMEGRIDAVDALTGAVIATRSDSDSVRMGAFGGDFYGDVEDFVEGLAEDLAEDLASKGK